MKGFVILMKKLVDVFTVLLLAAAFILAYFTGFVNKSEITGEPMLSTTTFGIISIIGVAILFAVGGASAFAERMKRGTLTKSFVALFVVEIFSVIGMITIMSFLILQMFTVDNLIIRALYIIFAMTGVVGYVDAVLFTDCVTAAEAPVLAEGEEEDEDAEYMGDYDVEEEDEEEDEFDSEEE